MKGITINRSSTYHFLRSTLFHWISSTTDSNMKAATRSRIIFESVRAATRAADGSRSSGSVIQPRLRNIETQRNVLLATRKPIPSSRKRTPEVREIYVGSCGGRRTIDLLTFEQPRMVERPSGKERRRRKVVKIFFIATRVSWILVCQWYRIRSLYRRDTFLGT